MSDTTAADLVRTFRTACGLPVRTTPRLIPRARVDLHAELLAEEVTEYVDAAAGTDRACLAHIARELADVVIVAYGAALDHGIDLDPVIAEVMEANLRKVVDGKVTRRDDGKILKPAGWVGPDVAGVLARQADAAQRGAARRWYIDTLRSMHPDAVLSARIDRLEAEEGA